MRVTLSLLWADTQAVKQWFATQTLSKILVLFGFLVLGGFISFGALFFSNIFFFNLSQYQLYGELTAEYLIHAAILILLWLALGSSLIAQITFLLNPSKNVDYLMTLPIKPQGIVDWYFMRSFFINIFPLLIVLGPIAMSFAQVFTGGVSLLFLLRFLFAVFALVIIVNTLGGIIAYLCASMAKGKGVAGAFVTALFFLVSTFVLLQAIFPKEMTLLYRASPEEFFVLYNSLPLSNNYLPTYWLTHVVVSGFDIYAFLTIILCSFLIFISTAVQSQKIIPLYQRLKERAFAASFPRAYSRAGFLHTRSPLLLKDWLSLLRSPSEFGYGLFLIAMAIFFFLFFTRVAVFRPPDMAGKINSIIFSFVWLLFFTTAYLMRLVFPLMAREGKTRWYILTLPLHRDLLVLSKVFLGCLLVIPHIVFGVLIWFVMPYAKGYIFPLSVMSTFAIILLALVQGFLGAVYPNFLQGDNPERVSTSMMGIMTLFLSSGIIALVAYCLHSILQNGDSMQLIMSFLLSFAICVIATLFLYTRYTVSRYRV